MINLARISSLLAVAFSVLVAALGQTPQTVVVARPGKIASYYNDAQNKTNVVLGFSDVGGEAGCGLYISANASYPGKTVVTPSDIKLTIMRITPEEKIKSAPLRDLTFTVDGQPINVGVMETASQQTVMDLRWETLQIPVPYESFVKIANGKAVEGKLGAAKFLLTENNLNFMRQFATRLKS